MVAVGKRNMRVKFEENQPDPLPSGRKQDNYVEFLTAWGYLRKITGRRGLEGFQPQLIGKWELTTMYQVALEDKVWKSMRVVAETGRFFTVESITIEEEGRKKDFVFILNETTSS